MDWFIIIVIVVISAFVGFTSVVVYNVFSSIDRDCYSDNTKPTAILYGIGMFALFIICFFVILPMISGDIKAQLMTDSSPQWQAGYNDAMNGHNETNNKIGLNPQTYEAHAYRLGYDAGSTKVMKQYNDIVMKERMNTS